VRRLLVIGVVALVLPPAASAKLCVKITTVPARPVAGAVTTIRMTTWQIEMVDGHPERGNTRVPISADTHFNVRATPAAGRYRLVPVWRTDRSDSVLEGRFVFPSAGVWTLAWSAFSPRYAGNCAGRTQVRVGGR
jgi:hypothetical protein